MEPRSIARVCVGTLPVTEPGLIAIDWVTLSGVPLGLARVATSLG
jgi:hypothetical protein